MEACILSFEMTELGRFSLTCRWRPRDPWHQRPHSYLDASIRCLPWRKMQDLRVGVRHDNCWYSYIYSTYNVNSSSFKKPTRVMHLCVWEWQYHATCLRGGGWLGKECLLRLRLGTHSKHALHLQEETPNMRGWNCYLQTYDYMSRYSSMLYVYTHAQLYTL